MQVVLISMVLCSFLALWANALPVKNVADTTNMDVNDAKHNEGTAIADKLVFVHLLRNRRAAGGRRYVDRDDYYDDADYAGYDRRGSDVGYMNQHDAFPTVVW